MTYPIALLSAGTGGWKERIGNETVMTDNDYQPFMKHAPNSNPDWRNTMRKVVVLIALVFIAVSVEAGRFTKAIEPVPGRYLVLFTNDVSPHEVPLLANAMAREHGGKVIAVMTAAANLFAVEMSEGRARGLANHPLVELVEEAAVVRIATQQTFGQYTSNQTPTPHGTNRWHLDRIDQEQPEPNGVHNYCEKASDVTVYVPDFAIWRDHQEFDNRPARIRDGVSKAHDEATVSAFARPCNDENLQEFYWGENQPYGHGTAVASVLGGKTIGVAKDVNIVPLRFHECPAVNDPVADTVRLAWALSWIKGWRCSDPLRAGAPCGSAVSAEDGNPDRARSRFWNRSLNKPMLISMSVYTLTSDSNATAIESVIHGLIQDDPTNDWRGITVIAAAGNQRTNNNPTTPARMAYRNQPHHLPWLQNRRVISVGGMGQKYVGMELRDVRWACPMYSQGNLIGFNSAGQAQYATATEPCWEDSGAIYGSNWGNTVDIYAPAHNVSSASLRGIAEYRNLHQSRSGTSFAAPIVAGMAARILQVEQNLTPDQVWERLRTQAVRGFYFDDQAIPPGIPHVDADPNGNNLLVNRTGWASCAPEYP